MKKLQVSTEFSFKSNGKTFYKVYVSRADGTMVPGTRTVAAFTGRSLQRVCRNMQADIDRGAWS